MTESISSPADYQHLRKSFRWDCPEYFNFVADVVEKYARETPNHAALHWVGSSEIVLTFAELAEKCACFAGALASLGLQPQSKVLLILPPIVEWWSSLLGILRAGLVAVPGTVQLTAHDLLYRINASEAEAIITDSEGADKIDAVDAEMPSLNQRILVGPPRAGWYSFADMTENNPKPISLHQTRSDDPALLYFTSGTTGPPKMVLHTQASYGLGHRVTALWLDLHPGDVHWNISDTGWAKAAWSSVFAPWLRGACVFVRQQAGKFRPKGVLQCLADYPITSMCAAPTIYRMLVQQDLSRFQPHSLQSCVAAGEPLNAEVIRKWQEACNVTIRDGYGQTETVLLCANFSSMTVKPGSMGLPPPGIDLAIVDDEGNPLPVEQEGNIAVHVEPERPLGLFKEYYKNERATADTFRNGWYLTGDSGRMDAEGYFWFVGRADDVITSSAYRIGPFEVESALLEHPAVAESAVVGKPDPVRGEIVKAFVVLRAGVSGGDQLVTELQEHVKRTTAPYKYPREIVFVDDLPKTISGKIRRVELRRMA